MISIAEAAITAAKEELATLAAKLVAGKVLEVGVCLPYQKESAAYFNKALVLSNRKHTDWAYCIGLRDIETGGTGFYWVWPESRAGVRIVSATLSEQ